MDWPALWIGGGPEEGSQFRAGRVLATNQVHRLQVLLGAREQVGGRNLVGIDLVIYFAYFLMLDFVLHTGNY